MAINGFYIDPPPSIRLQNFNNIPVATVNIQPGRWMVWVRVVLVNHDGDDQNASAELLDVTHSPIPMSYDRVDIRLRPGFPQSVSLQAALDIEDVPLSGLDLAIICSTFEGEAQQASLMVLEVDFLTKLRLAR